MNYPTLFGIQQHRSTDGRLGSINDARYFWQSHMTIAGQRAEPPELTDIAQLAVEIRRTYPEN